jgi:hypothetical protein
LTVKVDKEKIIIQVKFINLNLLEPKKVLSNFNNFYCLIEYKIIINNNNNKNSNKLIELIFLNGIFMRISNNSKFVFIKITVFCGM